jgi:CBS-domain-containing membrane protein
VRPFGDGLARQLAWRSVNGMFDWIRLPAVAACAAGGAIAVGCMEALCAATSYPLAAVSFTTSIVVVLGSPDAGPAQPRALIGGHLLSTLIGILTVKLCGPAPWAAAVAVGVAMIAMHVTGTFHPPAGIDPLVVVADKMSWGFLIAPVGLGVVLPVAFGYGWHNLVVPRSKKRVAWPARWW